MSRTKMWSSFVAVCLLFVSFSITSFAQASEENVFSEDAVSRDAGDEVGLVTVVHGVPGLLVDVYVNGALTLESFEPGTVTDPQYVPS